MMVGCSAPNCRNRSETSNLTFHRFPSDPERREIWLKNCNYGNYTPREGAKLCSIHFDLSQFEMHRADKKFKLKPNAIPTIFCVPSGNDPICPPELEDPLEDRKDVQPIFVPVIMWRPFHYENELYMIKITKKDDYEVYFNDLKNIWIQIISEASILEQFQLLNPMFDVKIGEAVSQVINLVEHITKDVNIEVEKSFDTIHLSLKSRMSEFEVSYKFNFSKASSDVFLKEMTVPLIQTVKCLEEQQKILCNLIQRKDRELEEYRLEKGEISRTDLRTEPFDENTLTNSGDNKTMLNIFGTSQSFWDLFAQQYGDVSANIADVKREPWNNVKRKRKVYSARMSTKKGKGINYNEDS